MPTTASRLAEVAAADAFLALPKTLDGAPPVWLDSDWGGEWAVTWNILDPDGVPIASLRFTARKSDPQRVAISVIWQKHALWRVDMDAPGQRHDNPIDAWSVGLPPAVSGPHSHSWPANRAHVLRGADPWDLPYREQLPGNVRRVEQGLLWLAERIELTIDPDQRGFDAPTKTDLFP